MYADSRVVDSTDAERLRAMDAAWLGRRNGP